MSVKVRISRGVELLEGSRVEPRQTAPERGPRLLFFSGGSALRPLCRSLKRYTHNSIHLITPFDSGGSSAAIRRAFHVLSVGDIRNRLVALADESALGNPEVHRLFAHRLPRAAAPQLEQDVVALSEGRHPLMAAVPEPMRRTLSTQLRTFIAQAPPDFDFAGANIGNLLLIGAYLSHGRDLEAAIGVISKLLGVRGAVLPTVDADRHLAARLADGRSVLGQHHITGKEAPPLHGRIVELSLVAGLDDPSAVQAPIGDKVRTLIRSSAQLVCYSYGSFYTSLIANLLPSGVGRAIASAPCRKLFVPNLGHDPEQHGMTLDDLVDTLLHYLRKDAGPRTPVSRLLDLVLLDRRFLPPGAEAALPRLSAMGVPAVLADISEPDIEDPEAARIDPERLAQVLVSLV